jgi:hypothetical protein
MKNRFRFIILSLCIFFSMKMCYSQKVKFDVLSHYSNIDSIYFKIHILSNDSLLFPSECEFFHSGIDINPMFTVFECEVKNVKSYEPVKRIGYDLNSVYLYLVNTIKASKYECESIVTAMDFKKRNTYRIRFLVHFERFNKQIPIFKSKWYYFRT